MPVFLRLRWAAFRLVRSLRRSILHDENEWELDADTRGRPILTAGPFRIVIVPRSMRVFDAVHLYCDDVEVWLPIIARLRLRNAVRLFVLRHAVDGLPDADAKRQKHALARPERPTHSA